MPDIASVLKAEVLRLARKEVRKEIESLRKASAQVRSDLAALTRKVSDLEHRLGRQVRTESKIPALPESEEGYTRFRFSAKRFAAQRAKLGLSAAEMGLLIGVSAQTVYHWESGKTRPKASQMAAVAATRKLGKRQIKEALAAKPE